MDRGDWQRCRGEAHPERPPTLHVTATCCSRPPPFPRNPPNHEEVVHARTATTRRIDAPFPPSPARTHALTLKFDCVG
eukprot:scaffold21263_cov141-Isochrysis_galbana.AAC.2